MEGLLLQYQIWVLVVWQKKYTFLVGETHPRLNSAGVPLLAETAVLHLIDYDGGLPPAIATVSTVELVRSRTQHAEGATAATFGRRAVVRASTRGCTHSVERGEISMPCHRSAVNRTIGLGQNKIRHTGGTPSSRRCIAIAASATVVVGDAKSAATAATHRRRACTRPR